MEKDWIRTNLSALYSIPDNLHMAIMTEYTATMLPCLCGLGVKLVVNMTELGH